MIGILNGIWLSILGYLKADWLLLLFGILLAVFINVYVDPEKFARFLERKAGMSIPAAVVFGAFTPLCACGTMAVLLSMFLSAMPWAPVMAFLVSSPLTSPADYLFESAFLGGGFAAAMLISSVAMGIGAGILAHMLSRKTRFFEGQFRLAQHQRTPDGKNGCGCGSAESAGSESCAYGAEKSGESGCGCSGVSFIKKYKLDRFAKGLYEIGVKKVLLYFVLFIAVGKIFEILIPKEWIMTLFSSDKAYSIPLSATIGLPLYLTDASALPLLRSFLNAGAGKGAVLAFLITGKATGIPVMAGIATILKKRAILFYIAFIYFGGILAGYLYQAALSLF